MSQGRVRMEREDPAGVAVVTLDNPQRKNAYDPEMRRQLETPLRELAWDDAIQVVLLRGGGGVLRTGADMNDAYCWYGEGAKGPSPKRRPSQRRRLLTDPQTFDFYQLFPGYPKVTVAEVSGHALGSGFELVLIADIAVVAADTVIAMPATRLLGPALGSLRLFFHRLGPVLARRLPLTGDTLEARAVAVHDREAGDELEHTRRVEAAGVVVEQRRATRVDARERGPLGRRVHQRGHRVPDAARVGGSRRGDGLGRRPLGAPIAEQ